MPSHRNILPRVRVAKLRDDIKGTYDPDEHIIYIAADLTEAERRCTLTTLHLHAELGHRLIEDPELEAKRAWLVLQEAARRLIPFEAFCEAAKITTDPEQLAALLHVDVHTLAARNDVLSFAERTTLAQIAMEHNTLLERDRYGAHLEPARHLESIKRAQCPEATAS